MKKILTLALCLVAFMAASAQVAPDAKTLFKDAETLDKNFKKGLPTPANPNAQPTADQAKDLLRAMELYEQVLALDTLPDASGKVKPKFTDKIMKAIVSHAQNSDFARAGSALFNSGAKYPEAYDAFMLSGVMAGQMGEIDTVYAVDFYNAGNCAYGTDFAAAHEAYAAARQANITDPQAYVYDIASLMQLAQQDESIAQQAKAEVRDIAAQAILRFGYDNDYIFNNYMQHFIDDNDYDGAMTELAKAIAQNPSHDNYYRLRGLVNFSNRKYSEAAKDFADMAARSDNYSFLREAAGYISDCGKRFLGTLNTVSPEQKKEILDMYQEALKVAAKAQQAPEAGSMDDVIEDINYNIENAQKL